MSRYLKYSFFRLNRLYRFLFLFFVTMVALYPIADTYWDCLCLSPSNVADYLNDPDDLVATNELQLSIADNLKLNHRDLKKNDHMCRLNQGLVQKISVRDELECAKKVDFPVTEERSVQSYHPLSSGLSPPTA